MQWHKKLLQRFALFPKFVQWPLVQLYMALAFKGPGLVPRIKRELAELLERDGFASVEEAVGADHRKR